jgi:hypothetical protein
MDYHRVDLDKYIGDVLGGVFEVWDFDDEGRREGAGAGVCGFDGKGVVEGRGGFS